MLIATCLTCFTHHNFLLLQVISVFLFQRAQSNLPTILDMLQIDNHHVANTLIDQVCSALFSNVLLLLYVFQ